MNKVLLKRLLFELFDSLARMEARLESLNTYPPIAIAAYVGYLTTQLQAQKSRIFELAPAVVKLFDEGQVDDRQITGMLQTTLPELRESLQQLNSQIYALEKSAVLPETQTLLSSLNLSRLLPDCPSISLLSTLNRTTAPTQPQDASLIIETLSATDIDNPLQWLTISEQFAGLFAASTLQLTNTLDDLNLPEPKLAVITPLIALRLMGPGYYPLYLLNAYTQQDALALWIIEPLLFQALNRFGLVNKDLVIMHQAIDKGKTLLNIEEPSDWIKLITEDVGETLLKAVEKAIPDKLAYTEKSLMRSQILEDRLAHGVLISAVPPLSSVSQLRDELDGVLDSAETPVYGLLAQLRETSATPREIINAGWLYKLDKTSSWLQAIFTAPTLEAGWSGFRQTLEGLDTILLKSIEIAQVHQILAQDESDAPLAAV